MANEIPTGGTQAGGGPGESDKGAPGGSSGTGGYGKGQNQANHQGQDNPYGNAQSGYGSGQDLDRGQSFDASRAAAARPRTSTTIRATPTSATRSRRRKLTSSWPISRRTRIAGRAASTSRPSPDQR
jgi:hypothetical protein